MLSSKIEKIKSSEAIKNVSKITGGTMLGQIISFIVVPIYTRLYGASIMGTWALFASIANIIVTFSDMGLKNAIMMEEDEKDTIELYTVITTMTLMISGIASLIVFIYYSINPKEGGLKSWMIAIFVFVLAITLQQTQTCYTWLNKKSDYSILMKNPVVNNVSAAIIIILLGVLGFKSYGYYLGTMAGQIITLIHMRIHLPNRFLNFNYNSYKKVFKRQQHFIIYQLPANVLAQVKEQIPTFLINGFFGAEMLGYYSISMRYLKMPISLLAQSIGRVYYQTTSDMKRKGQSLLSIGQYSLKNISRAMKLACIPMILIISVGDIACEILFGSGYSVAGDIMRIAAFNSFFLFIATATSGLVIVIDKQKYMLWCAIGQMAGYIFGISFGYYAYGSIYISCLAMTITFVLLQIVYFSFLFNATGVNWKTYVFNVFKQIIIIVLGAGVIRLGCFAIGIVQTM
ncbi:MAG: hypothetical protein E7307_02510 [Butyrivibrio sp.]|nr:hypothetical protein [Butyrivibrio sp.]